MARKDRSNLSSESQKLGHRQRMRQRILEHGTNNLADYELLEMLLFYVIPRRDTKPLAKDLIKKFGSLTALFQSPKDILQSYGLTERMIAVLKVPPLAARLLARDQTSYAPLKIDNITTLENYVSSHLRKPSISETYLFYLDGRNNLLEKDLIPQHSRISEKHRDIAIKMLEHHATAFIIIYINPSHSATVLAQEARGISLAVKPLSIILHDAILFGEGWISSLKNEGLL